MCTPMSYLSPLQALKELRGQGSQSNPQGCFVYELKGWTESASSCVYLGTSGGDGRILTNLANRTTNG